MTTAIPAIMAISAVVGAGATVAGGVKSEQARQAADNEAGRQAQKQADAEQTAAARLRDEAAKNDANAQREAQAARLKAGRRTGRQGTMLTGSLGASAQPQGGKTLLGM